MSNKTAVLTALQTIEIQETPMPNVGTVKVARRYCNDFQACLGAIQNGGED